MMAECIARTPDDFTVVAGSTAMLVHELCAAFEGAILALAALMTLVRSVGALHGVPGLRPRWS